MSFFEVLAECAVALAGFGAVHAMLRGSEGPRGMARAWCVVAYSGYAAFLSLVPSVMEFVSLGSLTTWRIASALGLVGGLVVVVSLHAIDISLKKLDIPAQVQIGKHTVIAVGYLVIAVQASNLVGWPVATGPFLFSIGLVLQLAAGFLPLFFSFLLPLLEVLQTPSRSRAPVRSGEAGPGNRNGES